MNLFTQIPSDFFAFLSSKNKEVYLGSLLCLFEVYEKGKIIGVERSLAVDTVEEYIEMNHVEKIEDEEHDVEIIDDLNKSEEPEEVTSRSKANFVLRQMIRYGWVQSDVMPDMIEYFSFPDYSISFLSAIKQIIKEEEMNDSIDPMAYHGYIYTIYSLLKNDENADYGLILDNVYKNTISFYRELRKIDYKLKRYLKGVVEKTEIKDLMEALMRHKEEILDRSYLKLKTSENVNKYKTFIIEKLKEYQDSGFTMNVITNYFMCECEFNYDKAYESCNDRINDIIDIFSSYDEFMKEIDEKNKNYINSTIAKIKFLLNNDTDIVGQLNTILRFAKQNIKRGKTEYTINKIAPVFSLGTNKFLTEDSLFTPRGTYVHTGGNNLLSTDELDISELERKFLEEYSSNFTEEQILDYIHRKMENKEHMSVSELFPKNLTEDDLIRLLYVIIYSDENSEFSIDIKDTQIERNQYKLNDFEIIRRKK